MENEKVRNHGNFSSFAGVKRLTCQKRENKRKVKTRNQTLLLRYPPYRFKFFRYRPNMQDIESSS